MGWENFAYLLAAKAWQFIRPWPMPGIHSPWQFWLLTLGNCVLYAAAFAGIYCGRKRILREGWAFLLVGICGFAAHTLFHVYMRHRVPFVEPALITFAAVALVKIWKRASLSALANALHSVNH
jgi:hypothetical protein